jgi:flagellar basal-body rod protein FlgB
MAGILSLPPAANTPLSSVQSGHEGHGGAPANADNGAFSRALNQAIAQKANSPEGSHAAHGGQVAGTASSASSAHPNHLSIGQGGRAGHDFQQKMLGVRAYRQQLLALNIANADMPGYKAVDIDINEAAQVVKSAAALLSLATTANGYLSRGTQAPSFPLKHHVPYQAAADGHTVDIDAERQKFSENSLMYQFSLDRVSGHFKHFMELMQNLR